MSINAPIQDSVFTSANIVLLESVESYFFGHVDQEVLPNGIASAETFGAATIENDNIAAIPAGSRSLAIESDSIAESALHGYIESKLHARDTGPGDLAPPPFSVNCDISGTYRRVDKPYGTMMSQSLTRVPDIGKIAVASTSETRRQRHIIRCGAIPELSHPIATADFTFNVVSMLATETLPTLDFYLVLGSPTVIATYYDNTVPLGTVLGTSLLVTPAAPEFPKLNSVPLDVDVLNTFAGLPLQILIVTGNEIAGAGANLTSSFLRTHSSAYATPFDYVLNYTFEP